MGSKSGSPGEDLFRRAAERSADVILVVDADGRIQFVNEACLAMFGHSDLAGIEGRNWGSLAPASAHADIRSAVAKAVRHGAGRRVTEIVGAGGSSWWDISASSLPDGDVVAGRVIVVMRDVTALRRNGPEASPALSEATATAAVFRSALRLAQLDVWRYDRVKERVSFTPELRENLGQSSRDQSFEEALTIWLPDDRALFRKSLDDAIRTCSEVVFEGRIKTPAGDIRWLRVLGEPEIVNGRCVALRGASQDITEELAVVARLQASEESALRTADTMSAFLATMSHEIRTPLNGVLGMAQAMAMGELPQVQRERLEVIQASGASLLALLNDLLDLSKVEAGRVELEEGRIDPQALAECARAFEPLLQSKDVKLNVIVSVAVAGRWIGDVTRVRQVLNNLVSNAIKFTERGLVEVELSTDEQDFIMRVSDSGIGIAADKLGDVFNKFAQADSSTTRRFGGTGLGLAICQELVTLMGGSIRVESVAGEGSTFTVRLPLAHVEAEDPSASLEPAPRTKPTRSASRHQLRVLAADDNPTNQLVLKTLLLAVGVDPVIVSNGQEAVDAWRGDSWDLILMDIHMPVMNGIGAATEIRSAELRDRRRRTPIIALTANAMTHQQAEYFAAGMDALVAKPIELPVLLATMDDVVAFASAPGRPPGTATPQD